MEKKTILDQIEIRDGSVGVRMKKQIVDGDSVLAEQFHRVTFDGSTSFDHVRYQVEAHLAEMGAAALSDADWGKIRTHHALVFA